MATSGPGNKTRISLPSIVFGDTKRQLRFICFQPPNKVYIKDTLTDDDIPLFMGGDAIAGSKITRNNHARTHAKYAREGMAIRVSFTDAILKGNTGPWIWFYTIEGLFKVTFEFLGKGAQKDCLTALGGMWLARYYDNPIPDKVVAKLDTTETTTTPPNRVNSQTSSSQTEPVDMWLGITDIGLPGSSAIDINMIDSGDIAEQVVTDTSESTSCSSSVIVEHENKTPNEMPHGFSDVSAEARTVRGSPKESEKVEMTAEQDITFSLRDKCFTTLIKTMYNNLSQFSGQSEAGDNIVHLLRLVLDVLEEELCHEVSPEDTLLSLSYGYSTLISNTSDLNMFENNFSLSTKMNVLLCLFSEWLGKRLHKLKPNIVSKVEEFKVRNIDSIDHLPPPYSMVPQLFPQCMVMLLLNWMGQLHLEPEVTAPDHTYSDSGQQKEPDRATAKLYSMIQLILEFTNNSLVTGVAHVVYSRL